MTTPSSENISENLIDLSPEGEEPLKKVEIQYRKHRLSTDSNDVEQNTSQIDQTESKHYSRLCGYLNKLGNNKILKTYRKRWFIFCENNCKLYYYRSPQDQIPLGEIDISQATFSFDVNNKDRTGLFTISVPGRDYFLEASSRQACLFWLQELQKYRRANSSLRTKIISEQSTSINDLTGRPQSGLLAQIVPEQRSAEEAKDLVPLMLPVDCPTDVIGDKSAVISSGPFSTAQNRLNALYNQVKTTASFVKYDKSPSESSPNMENLLDFEKGGSPVRNATTDGDSSAQRSSISSFKLKLSNSFRKSRLSEDNIDVQHAPGKEHCSKCTLLENKVESLTDEISNLHEEVATSREVLSVLQRQLDILSKEKETLTQIYQLNDSEKSLKLFNEKDAQLITLQHDVQEQKQDVEKLQRHIVSLKNEVMDLQKNNELFQEMLQQKDKTIMSLTNEIFELETERLDEKKRSSSESPKPEVSKPVVEPKETMTPEDLKDAVQAFELQNKFLNNELLELNLLRRDAEERVRLFSIKCSEWEARSYQIHSKLLFLLNELKRTDGQRLSPNVVSQLLQEAMEDSTMNSNIISSWSREKMYDDLGFNWKWGKEDLLSTKATNLKQKSADITNKAKDPELVSWRSKWDNFMVALGTKQLLRSPELKVLVRMGIPNEYKGKIWKGCSMMWIKNYKAVFGPDYYNSLLASKEYVSRLDPSAKQIELDLLRTLPNNCYYENLDSDGVPKLRRVLLAYSQHDPAVGYCQGLNRLAAIALLFMEEEDAFWLLLTITRFIMPEGYYSRTLIGAQVDQRVLKDLMADKLPRLHAHLEQNNVDLSLFTFNWFLTVFVDNIPVETYLRIWDVFLYEGSKVLFRYSLAIFKSCENDILQMKDYLAINKYLRSMTDQLVEVKKLTHIAFSELNPFPQRTITSKRTQHYLTIKAQLEEFESMRNSLPRATDKAITSDCLSEED